jgi:hypothetical protein
MKRINPDTGKEFQRGDKRPSTDKQDGMLFQSYRNTIAKKSGFYRENWRNANAFSKKKLPNPKTGKLWRQGDIGEDGRICAGYESLAKNDGYRRPKLMTPEQYEAMRTKKYSAPNANSIRRINPQTGKEFVRGDIGERGVFWKYMKTQVNKFNEYTEEWYPSIQDARMAYLLRNMKQRAKAKNLPFDLDIDYLKSIFPSDSMCPALKIEMKYLKSGRDNHATPSLDRIIPSRGYVKDNVVWVSMKANRIKTDATLYEITLVTMFYHKLFEEKGVDMNEEG